jgi:hypothetical protein
VVRAVRPEKEAFFASALGRGLRTLELEIDDHERRAIKRSLVARRSRLIETAEDTTLTPARRRKDLRELSAIASVLRKLRPPNQMIGCAAFHIFSAQRGSTSRRRR